MGPLSNRRAHLSMEHTRHLKLFTPLLKNNKMKRDKL